MVIVKETLYFHLSHQALYLILVDHILLDYLYDADKAKFLLYHKTCLSEGASSKLFDHMEIIETSLFYGWSYTNLYLKSRIGFFLKLSLIAYIVRSFFRTLHSRFIMFVLGALKLFEAYKGRDFDLFYRVSFL